MGVTGYEVNMYRDIGRIATALERIAKALDREEEEEEAKRWPDWPELDAEADEAS